MSINKDSDYEIFEKMTKQEIINWIKSELGFRINFNLPKESDIAWLRYGLSSKEDLKNRLKLSEEFAKISSSGWARKHDDIADKFNKETNIEIKLKHIDQMQILRKEFDLWLEKDKAQMAKEKKTKELYKTYESLRKSEEREQ
jgi:hypothetical protein